MRGEQRKALPDNVVTNAELAARIDTSDEWIIERTGIRQRHIAAPDETTASLAIAAAKAALADANMAAADIDLSGVTLDVSGDSLVFSSRGQIDMSGAGGPLGTAAFSAGDITFNVQFTSLGASKVEES